LVDVPPPPLARPTKERSGRPTVWLVSHPLPKTKMIGPLANRSVTSASSSLTGESDPSATSIPALLPIRGPILPLLPRKTAVSPVVFPRLGVSSRTLAQPTFVRSRDRVSSRNTDPVGPVCAQNLMTIPTAGCTLVEARHSPFSCNRGAPGSSGT
jgi:hypothetical protein